MVVNSKQIMSNVSDIVERVKVLEAGKVFIKKLLVLALRKTSGGRTLMTQVVPSLIFSLDIITPLAKLYKRETLFEESQNIPQFKKV